MNFYKGKRVIGSMTTFPALTAHNNFVHGKITLEEYRKLDLSEKTSLITEDFEVVDNEDPTLQSAKTSVASFFQTIWRKISYRRSR